MRNYKKFKLPRGSKSLILSGLKRELENRSVAWGYRWRQFYLCDIMPKEKEVWFKSACKAAVESATGMSMSKGLDFIVHIGSEDVNRHRDGLSKTCFLAPIKASPTLIFFEERQKRKISDTNLIRFNDFNDHGIYNEHGSQFILLSMGLSN